MKLQRSITESLLTQSLINLSDSIVRELALACKKIGIYGTLHPVAERALVRLLTVLKEAFKVKRFVTFIIDSGRLHVMSIRQREIVFTEEFIRYMQSLEIRAISFNDNITITELSAMVERLVKRDNKEPHPNLIPDFLKKKKIDSIEVNSERTYRIFEKNLKYRSDIDRDFTVRQVAMEQLGGDLMRLSDIYDGDDQALETTAIDFNNQVIQYLIPEKISAFRGESIIDQLKNVWSQSAGFDNTSNVPMAEQKKIGRLLALHPDKSSIINSLHNAFGGRVASLIRESVFPTADNLSIESLEATTDFEARFFTLAATESLAYAEMFLRMYRTGKRGQAIEILNHLIAQLSSEDWGTRQKALQFLIECSHGVNAISDKFVLEHLTVRFTEIIQNKIEKHEHAEAISYCIELGCKSKRFDIIIELVDSLSQRRTVENGVTIYDSMPVKAALMNLNRAEMLNSLIDELPGTDSQTVKIIQRLLIAIGSEEVARSLVKIISHPSRQLRQMVIKTLTTLGRPALDICAAVLHNTANFERPLDRTEIHDYKWYIVRNAIYVLGAIKDTAAVEPLRQRMSDPDIRVRREIVNSLEKIGGEESCDLILLMCEDPISEIRELALTKLGLIGTADAVPLVIDLLQRWPQMAVKCVQTIGQLGGEPGRTFLQLLLKDEHKTDDLTKGRVPKEDFKAAVVRALAKIGGPDSIESIKKYDKSLSGTQKLLIKNTNLESALKDVLSKK